MLIDKCTVKLILYSYYQKKEIKLVLNSGEISTYFLPNYFLSGYPNISLFSGYPDIFLISGYPDIWLISGYPNFLLISGYPDF